MDLFEAIEKRKSIRKYEEREVPEDLLRRVLDSVRLAPSAANRQPWHFFVVRDEKKRAAFKAAYDQEWFHAAPVLVVACADTEAAWTRKADGASYAKVDVAIAFDHLTLAAAALGLGTCWIAAFKPDAVRGLLELPDNLVPVALTPLGHPAKDGRPRERKSLDEIVTWV